MAVRQAIGSVQPWADRAARVGYVAKGLVFILVGALAVVAAAGLGGKATDPTGALLTVAHMPAGRVVLAFVGLGLIAHAAFRAALVLVGERYIHRGFVRQIARRVSNSFAFLIYLGLALTAGALALGWNAHVSADRNAESRHLSARILTVPFGRPLLFAVAVGVLVAAVVQVRWAFGPNHIRERLRVEEMTERQCKVVLGVGRIAFGTRAAVLATCGYFAARAAIGGISGEARGPAGALHAVWELPHGDLLLAAFAAGLIGFGTYGLLEARWRRLFGA
jgi:Domain of Unknown Function (DUF1206)